MADYVLIEESGALRIILPKGTNWTELILGTAAAVLFTKLLLPAAIVSFHRRPWEFTTTY